MAASATHPYHVVGIAGSLRRGSLNRALLRAAIELAPPRIRITPHDLIDIPLYNGDVEANAVPQSVTDLRSAVRQADALLIAAPEYNHGVPGVFKNAIDWLSRPPADIARVFGERPFALAGASPGGFGTILSQAHWLPVLKTLGVRLWSGQKLLVSRAGGAFDGDGRLVDEKVREQLAGFVRGFAGFAGGG